VGILPTFPRFLLDGRVWYRFLDFCVFLLIVGFANFNTAETFFLVKEKWLTADVHNFIPLACRRSTYKKLFENRRPININGKTSLFEKMKEVQKAQKLFGCLA